MSRGVIVLYRPKKGMDKPLLDLVQNHVSVLRSQKLATDRSPIIMRAADGTIVEIFEWSSSDAIKEAHHNPAVQELWEKFSHVCDYEIPLKVREFQGPFSEFEMIEYKSPS